MQIFLLEKDNSRFITITRESLRRYGVWNNYLWDYEITDDRIAHEIANGFIDLENNSVLWKLYEFLGQPYKDFDKWKYEMGIMVNQLSVKV